MIKTENLVILFTDIVGFTEATSLQSREQNRRILDKHNSLLLPIVKRFRGRHIKSIGDALLLVFNSPTDAMRCAMAMQDALHEYNIAAPKDEEIHIRIAASLGEVRISKGDIFGEPVNVTSRIEGITPADEIYFSEAVYLAMNKAEVPAVEIGVQELKGISKPVRIFSIPRFSENRLVPEPSDRSANEPRLGFPFGGMHLAGAAVANTFNPQAMAAEWLRGRTIAIAGGLIGCVVGLFALFQASDSASSGPAIAALAPVVATGSATAPTAATTPESAAQVVTLASIEQVALAPTGVASPPPPPTARPAEVVAQLKPKSPSIANIAQAKLAYRAGRITKDRYREIVNRLEEELDMAVRRAKTDYREGRISKDAYRSRVEGLKMRYEGE